MLWQYGLEKHYKRSKIFDDNSKADNDNWIGDKQVDFEQCVVFVFKKWLDLTYYSYKILETVFISMYGLMK